MQNSHPVNSTKIFTSLFKITRDKFSLYWLFKALASILWTCLCFFLASFRKNIAHDFRTMRWNNTRDYKINQSICLLFHGRTTGTTSLPPCLTTSLFRWRPCSFCTRLLSSAVSDSIGISLGRQSRPKGLVKKLAIASKHYKKKKKRNHY